MGTVLYHSLSIIAAIFLLGLTALPASSAGQNDGPARKLINAQGCKACHALGGDGGTLAGSFEDMRAKLSRTQVRRQLANQDKRHGKGTIPDFSHLSAEEIETLVNFIKPEL